MAEAGGADGPSPVAPGVVYLVGAGPGAVGLLTLRAAEILGACDVVLHDRLVPAEIVRLARPDAEIRYVGKDGVTNSEKMKGQQDDISKQCVELAKKGLAVCRLKGGDPMIYGRAGEEMEECAAAGVPYEVVPAVTAALSASADACVPLTYRKVATSVRLVTLNPTTTRDEKFDWSQFAAPDTTYTIYMGLAALGNVCEKMMAAGVKGETPMAVVDRSSMPQMQTVVGTVATLPAIVKDRPDLEGPAIVMLGDVVSLRERTVAPKAPAPPPVDAALARAMSALPAVSEDGLRKLQGRIAELLAAGEEGGAGAGAKKRPAPE